MSPVGFAPLVALALLLPGVQALPDDGGGSVYRWQDAQGQVHFSDQPPADPAAPVETYLLPKRSPASSDPEGDYYSVENQARRLEAERLKREAARLEKERQRLEDERRTAELEALRNPPAPKVEALPRFGYPVYVPVLPPMGPPHRPRPVHPPFPRPPDHRDPVSPVQPAPGPAPDASLRSLPIRP